MCVFADAQHSLLAQLNLKTELLLEGNKTSVHG